ncbi:hypothetical protein CENSYa_0712 [Cenarchaeum symbiosum A]|uniref:Uncharacterized protein n=1 Tax=Cenarchaeum symbiosum (strain A) TaxID=414004 RepID=A0RVH8_CENSY|nr:hypothetical protein CENSYa_0712 [Cenarchaeum symbiosum A]
MGRTGCKNPASGLSPACIDISTGLTPEQPFPHPPACQPQKGCIENSQRVWKDCQVKKCRCGYASALAALARTGFSAPRIKDAVCCPLGASAVSRGCPRGCCVAICRVLDQSPRQDGLFPKEKRGDNRCPCRGLLAAGVLSPLLHAKLACLAEPAVQRCRACIYEQFVYRAVRRGGRVPITPHLCYCAAVGVLLEGVCIVYDGSIPRAVLPEQASRLFVACLAPFWGVD